MAASRPGLLRAVAALAMLLPQGCRREPARLDEVQKMAYAVKPAVVRISAYATAELVYDPETIRAVADLMRSEARDLPATAGVIPTGAGGSGSGFAVHPDGYIVTSGHVVEPTMQPAALRRSLLKNGAVSALVRHFPKDDLRALQRADGLDRLVTLVAEASSLRNVNVIAEVELSNGEKRPFTIVRFSPPLSEGGSDLAVLHIDRKNLPVLDLGDSDTTRVGESIWSVGYPAVASSNDDLIGVWLSRETDLEATFNPGQITSIKRNAANAPLLQTNVAIYGGNSGGPAVGRDGRVVGISTWGHKDAEQIKFLVPINVAKSLITSAGVPLNADGEFNRSYDAALEAAYDGDWTAARRQLAVAEKLFPNSPVPARRRPRHSRAAVLAAPSGADRRRAHRAAGDGAGAGGDELPPAAAADRHAAAERGRDHGGARRARQHRPGSAARPLFAARQVHDPQRLARRREARARRFRHSHRPGVDNL
jgi:S1-C subfamily serine protease